MNEELKVIISAEVDKLKKGVEEAKGKISEFAGKSGASFKQYESQISKAGEVSNKVLKKTALAIGGGISALMAFVPATEEYRNAQAKLNTAFESVGSSAEQAKETYNELYRVLGDGDVAVEAAGHLAKLTTNEKELSEWTTICEGVYATFGDSLPIEGLTEAANETAKVGQLTGVLADALNWAGVNEEEFQAKLDACNTEAEREALIRETLTGLYDEAAENYEKNAAGLLAQQEAEAKMAEATAELGEALQPVMTALTELGADILADLAPYIQEFAEENLPAIKDALDGVGEKVGKVIDFVVDNWQIIAAVGGVILTIAAAISILSAGLTAYNTVTAITAVVTASAFSPVLIAIGIITALIAIIVLVVKNIDKLQEVWNNFFNKAADILNGFSEKCNELFEKILNIAKEKFEAIKTAVTDKITGAKDKALNIFGSIKDGIKGKIEGARDVVKNAIEKIKGFFNFKWELPKIKLPHFDIKGKFSLNPPSIPKFSVSWYKMGGVFDNPTLFPYGNGQIGGLGEAGAEAIVPLEKNTKWMNVLAEKLAERQGNTPIILQVDGKTFAQTTIKSINDLTRQTGTLALNLR